MLSVAGEKVGLNDVFVFVTSSDHAQLNALKGSLAVGNNSIDGFRGRT